jgi:hypothetical protein
VNTALRRIFGPDRKEVAGGWRRLHNEELHNLYAAPNIIEMGRMTLYKNLVRIPEGERSRGRPWCRWENNISIDHWKIR